jgi:hypothetical protein
LLTRDAASRIREKVAVDALRDLIAFLRGGLSAWASLFLRHHAPWHLPALSVAGGDVAIYDATNTTRERRRAVESEVYEQM